MDALLGGMARGMAPRFDEARQFALRNRTLLLRADNGTPVDIALGALPFEERTTGRASPWVIGPDIQLLTCSAEDLVVHKVFASRDKDWLDVEGIVGRQGSRPNRRLVEDELRPLLELKDAAQDMNRLAEILNRRPA